MIGRLIQNNPFVLRQVDKLFYNFKEDVNIDENIIFDYINYIKPKIYQESLFRLLSPLLNIYFGIPNSKSFKSEIHEFMKEKKLSKIENLFLQFVKENKLLLN